ncbi:MAG: hypothetical protein ACKOXB_03905 [Flavobacteriales bacterium]
MMKKDLFLLAIAFLLFTFSWGQDFAADFLKIQEANKEEKLAFKFKSITLVSNGIRDSVMQAEGISLRFKDKYYLKTEMHETFCDGDRMLVINHHLKIITVYNGDAAKQFFRSQITKYNELNVSNDSVVFYGSSNGVKSYTLYLKKGTLRDTRFKIDSAGHVLETAMHYRYNEGEPGTKEAVTTYFDYKNNIEKSDFIYKLSDYIIEKKGNIQAVEKYSGYKIYNQINE